MAKFIFLTALLVSVSFQAKGQSNDLDSLQSVYNFEVIDGGVQFDKQLDSIMELSKSDMYPLVYDAAVSMFTKNITSANKETGTILIDGYEFIYAEFPYIIDCSYRMRIKVIDGGCRITAKYFDYYTTSRGKKNLVGFIRRNYPFEELNDANKHVRVPDECFINVCKRFHNIVGVLKNRITGDDF